MFYFPFSLSVTFGVGSHLNGLCPAVTGVPVCFLFPRTSLNPASLRPVKFPHNLCPAGVSAGLLPNLGICLPFPPPPSGVILGDAPGVFTVPNKGFVARLFLATFSTIL